MRRATVLILFVIHVSAVHRIGSSEEVPPSWSRVIQQCRLTLKEMPETDFANGWEVLSKRNWQYASTNHAQFDFDDLVDLYQWQDKPHQLSQKEAYVAEYLISAIAISQMTKGHQAVLKPSLDSWRIGFPARGMVLARIEMIDSKESRKWMQSVAFRAKQPNLSVLPLMIGFPSEGRVERLNGRLQEAISNQPKNESEMMDQMDMGEINNFAANRGLIYCLQSAIAAEKFCLSLPKDKRPLFREFFVDLHRSLSCARSGFRDSTSDSTAAADLMTHYWQPGYEEFWRTLFTNEPLAWYGNTMDRCPLSVAPYLVHNLPQDFDMNPVARIARSDSPKAGFAKVAVHYFEKQTNAKKDR